MKVILLFLFFSLPAHSDEFEVKSLSLGLVNSSTTYVFEASDDFNLEIKTNTKTNLEFSMILDKQLISLKLPLENNKTDDEVAQTNGYSINYLFNYHRYIFQFDIQHYKGYNLNNISTGEKRKRLDIKSDYYQFEWNYFFNKEFVIEDSYLPLLKLNLPINNGSWLITNSISRMEVSADDPFNSDISKISNEVIRKISLSDDLVFSTLAVRGGYYYTDKFYRQFFYTGMLTIGLGNQVVRADGDVFNHSITTNALEFSVGYNYKDYIFGTSLKSQSLNTALENDAFKATNTTLRFFYKINF